MKRLFLTVVACFISIAVAAQVPVPYIFVPNTPASATQVNANFDVLAKNALNVANGVLTGNLVPLPGITVDGIDISDAFGGGTKDYTLTVDKAILIGPAPQLTFGLDGVSTITVSGDGSGNATFEALKAGGQFYFVDPVNVPALVAASLQVGTLSCPGCIDASDIAPGALGAAAIQDGSVGTAEIADGSLSGVDIADGSIGAADIADGSVGAAELDNILGAKAGIYGDAVTVARINVDTDGRIIDVVNTPITFPAPTYANIPETAITDGAILARVGSPETITQPWTHNANVTMAGASRIMLPNGTFDLPPISFVNGPNSGMYLNPNNNLGLESVEFGARFSTDNRALIRAFRTGGSRLDFIVGTTITMHMIEQGVNFGYNAEQSPVGIPQPTQLTLYGDLIPPSPTTRVHYIGWPGAEWKSIAAESVLQTSDIRLKIIKGDISGALAAVESLGPKLAAFKTDPSVVYPTFSAQDVAATLDKRYGTTIAVYRKKEDAWGLDYGKMTPILWQAVKELNAKVNALEKQLAAHKH